MKLLTQAIARTLPPLYATEEQAADDHVVITKFFEPDGSWTWYVMEADAVLKDGSQVPLNAAPKDEIEDVLFFGVVDGFELEWGYFRLNELSRIRGHLGLPVERDLYWSPKPWREVKAENGWKHRF